MAPINPILSIKAPIYYLCFSRPDGPPPGATPILQQLKIKDTSSYNLVVNETPGSKSQTSSIVDMHL